MADIVLRPGTPPGLLTLPWDLSVTEWDLPEIVDLPKGISRHEVRFLQFHEGLYVVKELPTAPARRDYEALRLLRTRDAPAVATAGIVTHRNPDPTAEASAALVTEYERHSFSYRELLSGPGFGARRRQMLDAFAMLLVRLHLAGCFWGDCSLSNVLYRFDADAIETIMVDAETAEIFPEGELSDGKRAEDLTIMEENVAGGMADIAAAAGAGLDDADLGLGEDIAARYEALWSELTAYDVLSPDETYRIRERIERLNGLGFDVDEVSAVETDGGRRIVIDIKVGGRNFHVRRLRELTGIEALENQARQLLDDLFYFMAQRSGETASGKQVEAIRWRVSVFEPWLNRLSQIDGVDDPVQAYCDILHLRYVMSAAAGRDVGTEAAFDEWLASGRPGYPVEP